MSVERRRAVRYPLVADAEIVNPLSHVCLKGRTSDMSLLGCFINTIFSLLAGTEIQVQLKHEGKAFIAGGAVVRSEPSMGLRVSFGNMKGAQLRLLQKWLAGLQPVR
jgi:hypothetical protein